MQHPDPSPEAVALWLKQLDRDKLHGEAWIAINRRFNGITLAIRPFMNTQFADEREREAAFDGLTLALAALAHFEDITALEKRFKSLAAKEDSPQPS